MRVLEDVLKRELASRGVSVPEGGFVSDLGPCPAFAARQGRAVVKLLAPHNDRLARGEIVLAPVDELSDVCARLASTGWPVWIEEWVPHERAVFLGVVWPGQDNTATVVFAPDGGTGIERRATEGGSRSVRLPLDADPADVLANLVGGDAALSSVATALVEVFETTGAVSIELNPVAIGADGRATVLDAKSYVDPYARDRSSQLLLDVDRREVPEDVLLEFAALEGPVGVLSIGAGLTRALIDWLDVLGTPAACFSDLIPAVLADAVDLLGGRPGPNCEAAGRWLAGWLDGRGVDCLLVNLVSGGTPLDILSESLVRGLEGWDNDLIAFMGGNRAEAACEVWSAAERDCPATMAAALDLAARRAGKVS